MFSQFCPNPAKELGYHFPSLGSPWRPLVLSGSRVWKTRFTVSDHLGDPWCALVLSSERALSGSRVWTTRSCFAASALCSHGSHWLCCFLFLFFPVFGLLAIGCHHLPSKNTPSTVVEFFLQNVFLHKNSHPLGIPPLRLIRMSSKTDRVSQKVSRIDLLPSCPQQKRRKLRAPAPILKPEQL